jgi:hypothetical protein
MRRTWHYFVSGLLSSVAKDYLELRGVDGVVLTYATEMRQFVASTWTCCSVTRARQ